MPDPHVRPNVLIIQADQFRWDCLGAAGNADVRTPNLDRLAEDAVRYPNAFTPYPLCTPSRYSMLSGLYVRQHAGWTNRSTLAPGVETFPRALRRSGYRTAAVGKMHFTPTYLDVGYDHMELAEQDGPGRYDDDYHRELSEAGLAPVSDLVDQEPEYRSGAHQSYWHTYGSERSNLPEKWHSTTWIAERALSELDRWKERGGQLLHVSFVKPHHPFDPPAPWDERYDPEALIPPPGWTDQIPEADRVHGKAYFDYEPLTLPVLRRVMAHYYATISHLDHHVGRLLDRLRERRLYHDTLIIFVSDHGEYLGFHHLLLKDGPMYDPLVKVPLLIKFPATTEAHRRGGHVDDELVSLVDVAPTVLAACGLTSSTVLPGVDLTRPGAGHSYVFAEDRRDGVAYLARSRRHKLLMSDGPGRDAFFDLDRDPCEIDNRIADASYADQVSQLREALSEWALRTAIPPPYVDGAAPQTAAPGPADRAARRAFIAAQMRSELGGFTEARRKPR